MINLIKNFYYTKYRKKKKFFFEPFIYITENGLCYKLGLTSRVKWLEKFEIEAYNQKEADDLAFNKVNNQYIEYKNHIWFF